MYMDGGTADLNLTEFFGFANLQFILLLKKLYFSFLYLQNNQNIHMSNLLYMYTA